jgi:hypothetical protein
MNHPTSAVKFGIVSLALLLASPIVGWASVPVIPHSAPVDIFYNAASPGDAQFGYRIVATGSPTTFEATGLPLGAKLDRATGWINGTRNAPGIYDVAVRATNAEGVGTATVRLAIHPAATGVISSQGTFRTGQSFTFTVRYNAPVNVTGAPALALVIGAAAAPTFKNAAYVSGSGTAELVFRYVVTGGDLDLDGVQLLPSVPAGGAICGASGLTASPSLPVRHFVSGIKIAATATAEAPTGAVATQSLAIQR